MSAAEKTCPLCASADLIPILSRSKSAVLQNRVFVTEAEARGAAAGMLAIKRCGDCGFIHNAAFDPDLVEYVPEYENEQGNSARFRTHMADVIGRIRQSATGAATLSIVDVGCGQGGFLDAVTGDWGEYTVRGFGFDTAYRGLESPSGNSRFFRDYFGPETGGLVPSGEVILVTRHVIEHVPDPVGFLRDIRSAIRGDQQARLFIETPCAEWIFRNRAVQDFFYEHCNYWTADSLARAGGAAGFETLRVEHVFGGQYLWLEAIPAEQPTLPRDKAGGNSLAEDYVAHETETLAAWRKYLVRAAGDGRVALWGAGAKGVTMAVLLDADRELIDCLIDINPRKQGGFIPITAHPVVDLKTAHERGVRAVFVMNPNYKAEICDMLAAERIELTLIDETMVIP